MHLVDFLWSWSCYFGIGLKNLVLVFITVHYDDRPTYVQAATLSKIGQYDY